MGVVRREGDWRLEKEDDGVYEITYRNEPHLTVLTPDYEPEMFDSVSFGLESTRDVGSYQEAVGLFEELAHGPPPTGFGLGGGLAGSTSAESDLGLLDTDADFLGGSGEGNLDDIEAPPGVIAIALLLVGGLVIAREGFAPESTVFKVGIAFTLGGVLILGWAGVVYRQNGLSETIEFLWTAEDAGSSSTTSNGTEKTPPAPQRLREELMFDRAGHHCEWCENRYDRLQIHHIEPRSEGGPNTKRNLIALCPTCHDKADHGGISKTQLKGKVRQIMAE